jgi:hypothetical protein
MGIGNVNPKTFLSRTSEWGSNSGFPSVHSPTTFKVREIAALQHNIPVLYWFSWSAVCSTIPRDVRIRLHLNRMKQARSIGSVFTVANSHVNRCCTSRTSNPAINHIQQCRQPETKLGVCDDRVTIFPLCVMLTHRQILMASIASRPSRQSAVHWEPKPHSVLTQIVRYQVAKFRMRTTTHTFFKVLATRHAMTL